ncbi:MAG: sigma-70 family RNA polymerase sigma factor [Thermomicrobiales bacterium]
MPDELSDLDIVLRSRTNPDAFGLLFARYWPAIFTYCLRRLQEPDAADDAASSVFVKAFAARERFQSFRSPSGHNVRSWLFSIAHNVVVDAWRSNRQTLSVDRPGSTIAATLADRGTPPEDEALDAEEARVVAAVLTHLPERQRSLVELRLSGLSTTEVAEILGLSVSATKSLQFRAYRALRDVLRANPALLTREIPS